jgi:hypothetical protein
LVGGLWDDSKIEQLLGRKTRKVGKPRKEMRFFPVFPNFPVFQPRVFL